ncbi:MAG TPA: DNA polymerase Y family protein, partial [Rhodocyclaceae bacterium]|nr:DNA polymerase Y family protein [Rhodocyclaceae bacterium]
MSIAPPQALLLEIGGCARLFGGLERLKTLVAQGLTEQAIAAALAVAPTPQAALWLAEGGGDELDPLPVARLSWPGDTATRLDRFGLRTLGEIRRLPAAALGRRLGKEAMVMIGRAYGELPDPRPDFVFPLHFEMALELPATGENAAALLFAARRLTAALAGWLAARQAGLRECVLHIAHRGREATKLPLRFAAPTRDSGRLERVLRERLERLVLQAPAESLALAAARVESLAGRSGDLFDAGGAGEAMAALVERLRARLGEERIHGLGIVADHRPECASDCNSSSGEQSIKKHAG